MAISPDRYSVHVDRPNSQILVASIQPDTVYIHDRVFPKVQVANQSDLFFSMPPDSFYRTGAEKRGPGSETPGVNYSVNPNNRYSCDVYGVHIDLDDQTIANYDQPLDPERDATMLLGKHIKIRKEIDWVQRYFRLNVWTGFRTAANLVSDFDCTQAYSAGQWDLPNANPIGDVDYLIEFMMSQTGFKPNVLVIPRDVLRALCNNPAVYGRKSVNTDRFIDKDWLAAAFGVEEVILAEAVLNNAQVGQARNMGFMLKNTFLLAYRAPSPGIMQPSAGYDFIYTGGPYNGLEATIRQFRMEHLRSTRMEAEVAYDYKIVCSDMGILGKNVLSVA